MMKRYPKPVIFVSRCIEFDGCRYNGQVISSETVRRLKPLVEFHPVCPEVEIGLGIPRDPIRVVDESGDLMLIQPETGRDVSALMRRFTSRFLGRIRDVDGFILKNRSPSCGLRDVKIFKGLKSRSTAYRGAGFFGGRVLDAFGHLAIEDEGRLTNFRIREHFLTSVYSFTRFKASKHEGTMRALVAYHTEHKLLLMAYNQKELRLMGATVANHDGKSAPDVYSLYEKQLQRAFRRPSRHTSNINVLMHSMGYFSGRLNAREKAFFLDLLDQYRDSKVPLSAVLSVLRSWIIRFDEPYLRLQAYFSPYPEELVAITDSGKGRTLG